MSGIKSSDVLGNDVIPKLNTFKSALDELIKTTNKLKTANVQLASSTGNSYDKSLARVNALIKQKESALRQLNKAYKETDQSINYNVRSLSSLIGASKTAQQQISNLNKEMNKSSSSGSFLANTFKKIGLYALAYISIQSFEKLVISIFDTTKKLESLDLTLKTISRSISEQTVITGFLEKIANAYGLEIKSLTDRFLKFKAAADQSNYSLNNTIKIYSSVTKAGAVMGLSQYEIEGALLALEQMMSKGKVTTEELRRQLGERLPGAMGIMANALGVTIVELDKMLKKGEVLSADALPKFADALEKAYGIENVKNVDTLIAAQNRLGNAWTGFIKSVQEGNNSLSGFFKGFFNLLTGTLKLLTTFKGEMNNLREGKSLESFTNYVDTFYLKYGNLSSEEMYLAAEKELQSYEKYAEKLRLKINELNKNRDEKRGSSFDPYDLIGRYSNKLSTRISRILNTKDNDNDNKSIIETEEYIEGLTIELGKAEGKATALKDILKSLSSIENPPELVDENKHIPNYYNEKDKNTYHQRELSFLNDQLEKMKEISNNKDNDSKQRLDALNDEYIIQKKIIELETENKNTKRDLEYIEEKKEINKAEFKTENDRVAYLKKVEEKYNDDKELITEESNRALNNLYAQNTANKVKAIEDGYKKSLELALTHKSTEETNEITILNEQYKSGLINKEDYEKKKTAITEKYLKERLNLELDAVILEMQMDDYITDEEWNNRMKLINELRTKISELGLPDNQDKNLEKIKDYWKKIYDAAKETLNGIGELVDSSYERNITNLENYKQKRMEFYDREYELAEGDAVAQKLIKEEQQKEEDKINKKILIEKRKQAIANKKFAAFNTIISTAEAVMSAFKEPNVPFPMKFLLASLYGAIGIMKLATINNQPLPEYRLGTKNHKGGLAYVGDGGRAEVVVEPNSEPYITPSKKTLAYLEKGAKVYPSIDDFRRASINTSLILATNNLNNKKDAETVLNIEIEKQIKNGFKGVKINNNNKINNSLNDYYYKKLNTQF